MTFSFFSTGVFFFSATTFSCGAGFALAATLPLALAGVVARVRFALGGGAATTVSCESTSSLSFFVAAPRERLATGGGVLDDSGDAARFEAVRPLARVGLAVGAGSVVGWRARRGGMMMMTRRELSLMGGRRERVAKLEVYLRATVRGWRTFFVDRATMWSLVVWDGGRLSERFKRANRGLVTS